MEMLPMILGKASNLELVRAYGQLTIAKILDARPASIARLKNEHGEEKVQKAMAVLVADASKAFGDALPQGTALEYAGELVHLVPHLTFEDCFLALQELKKGKVFKYSLNTILSHLNDYTERRVQLAMQRSHNEYLANKENRALPGERSSEQRTVNNPFEKFKLDYSLKQEKKL
jgi:hypothetical protein